MGVYDAPTGTSTAMDAVSFMPSAMPFGPLLEGAGWMMYGAPTKRQITDRNLEGSYLNRYGIDKNDTTGSAVLKGVGALSPTRWLSGLKNVYHQTIGRDN